MHSPVVGSLDLLNSPVRREIVDILANLPLAPDVPGTATRASGLTAAQLGELLDLHITTVRFHVDQLVEAGLLLTHDVRAGVGRPRRHYAASPGSVSEIPRPDTYKILAQLLAGGSAEADAGGVRLSAEELAERWVDQHANALHSTPPAQSSGQFLAKIDAVVALLEQWGYTPEVTTTEAGHTAEMRLPSCPVRELAERHPSVACGIHRGLIRGALANLGEPDAVISLRPFVSPQLCVARVTSARDFSDLVAD